MFPLAFPAIERAKQRFLTRIEESNKSNAVQEERNRNTSSEDAHDLLNIFWARLDRDFQGRYRNRLLHGETLQNEYDALLLQVEAPFVDPPFVNPPKEYVYASTQTRRIFTYEGSVICIQRCFRRYLYGVLYCNGISQLNQVYTFREAPRWSHICFSTWKRFLHEHRTKYKHYEERFRQSCMKSPWKDGDEKQEILRRDGKYVLAKTYHKRRLMRSLYSAWILFLTR